jgi:type I restriction enzyme S subunit
VKSQELVDARISSAQEHITVAGLRGSSAKLLPPHTVLIAMYGATVGQLGYLDVEASVNQAICGLITDPDVTDPRFLYYALMHSRTDLVAYAHGAAQQNLSQERIRNFRLSIPDIDHQRQIAAVLGAIDDLIENNQRRIELLERMARATYHEWFALLRFPGHEGSKLVDSPLGPIPDGWCVCNLFDIADVGFGFSFKSNRFAETGPLPVVRIRDVPGGSTKTFTNEQPSERYRVLDGDVLIGMDGDFHLRQWTGGDAWLNQRVARLRPLAGISARHLMLAIEKPIAAWNAAISGTTVAHLGKRHLEQIEVLVPSTDLLHVATPWFDCVAAEERVLVQSKRRLAAMRDALLPRLVTGSLDLSHVDLSS